MKTHYSSYTLVADNNDDLSQLKRKEGRPSIGLQRESKSVTISRVPGARALNLWAYMLSVASEDKKRKIK